MATPCLAGVSSFLAFRCCLPVFPRGLHLVCFPNASLRHWSCWITEPQHLIVSFLLSSLLFPRSQLRYLVLDFSVLSVSDGYGKDIVQRIYYLPCICLPSLSSMFFLICWLYFRMRLLTLIEFSLCMHSLHVCYLC